MIPPTNMERTWEISDIDEACGEAQAAMRRRFG
jgi:hypothetical protein